MAGTSPYFKSSTCRMDEAVKKAVMQYRTRRTHTKIEYEEKQAKTELVTDNLPRKKQNCENLLCKEETNEKDIPVNDSLEGNSQSIPVNVTIKQEVEDSSYHVNDDQTDIKKIDIKKDIKNESGTEWVPKDWQVLLSNIREMRKYRTAVVDSLGCERLSDENDPPHVKRFQTFTSLLLSAQTRDQVTAAAVGKLKEHGLTVPNIARTPESRIGELIKPVGFWQRKSQYLKKCAIILEEKYSCDIPNDLQGLLALPGFGPKMAHICMHAAWGKMTGIGVDTHVHRISNRLGWVRKPTKTAEHTRKELECWLPRVEWDDINILLVGFGQEICRPVGPICEFCLNKDVCPSAFKEKGKFSRSSPTKVKKQQKMKTEVKQEDENCDGKIKSSTKPKKPRKLKTEEEVSSTKSKKPRKLKTEVKKEKET